MSSLTVLSGEIVDRLVTLLWPLLRISAMLLTAPPFSTDAFNLRIRVLLAATLTWFVYPLHDWPVIDPVSAQGLLEVFNQILIGVVMGLVLQVVVAALVVAGQAMSAAMGLSMANLIDPTVGNVPVLAQFLLVLSTLIFVGFGGHALLVKLVLQSFDTLPVGAAFAGQDLYGRVVRWSAMTFLGALLLALPVMATLLFVNVGLGVVTRAAPSLNIFAVGFPALILAGFLVLLLSIDSVGGRIEWLWMQGFELLRDLLGLT
ncbi:MAG: Flagellar biosynthetic protein FliR [Pseudomonadota bacterium]|jgi:flagellar biosynthetic protein FliR